MGDNNTNTTSKEIYIGPNELVFNNETGIQSGGFSVSDIMNKAGISPIMSINSDIQGGGGQGQGSNKISDLFQNLAVPNWATMYNMSGGEYKEKKKNDDDESDSDIDDDLHDRLLELVKEHDNKFKQKKIKTKRNLKIDKKNITKKNKKNKIE
jgi:hypothetical protein